MKVIRTLGMAMVLALACCSAARAQWSALANPPPFRASTALLLTDGTVMCQDYNATGWWNLVPDQFGSYINGTWNFLASMTNPRLYYASAVMYDGTVVVAGGEYSGGFFPFDLDDYEVYSPFTQTWTDLGPGGWGKVGDAPCVVLPNGTLLLGSIQDSRTAIYDPSGPFLFDGPSKLNATSAEETWTLMRNGNVLTADCFEHPLSQFFSPNFNSWINAGPTTAHFGLDLVEAASIEIGPAIQLPQGRVIAFGATGHNSTYDPSSGIWKNAIDSPFTFLGQRLGIKDGPAALLPDTNVLVAMGPVDGIGGDYLGPTSFFEYTGSTFKPAPNPSVFPGLPPFTWRFLLLPTGQVLATNGTGEAFIYTNPGAVPDNRWRPTLTNWPRLATIGTYYQITGTQFNGLSQANSYGDDAAMATNYPIVRITNRATGHVSYAFTVDHSTMAISTGNAAVTTFLYIFPGTETGPSWIEVVANGIPSKKYEITILPQGGGG